MLVHLDGVVQRLVKFYPVVSKNYNSVGFSKEKVTIIIKYCSDFPRKKFVNSKFSNKIRLCEVGNKTMG